MSDRLRWRLGARPRDEVWRCDLAGLRRPCVPEPRVGSHVQSPRAGGGCRGCTARGNSRRAALCAERAPPAARGAVRGAAPLPAGGIAAGDHRFPPGPARAARPAGPAGVKGPALGKRGRRVVMQAARAGREFAVGAGATCGLSLVFGDGGGLAEELEVLSAQRADVGPPIGVCRMLGEGGLKLEISVMREG